MNFWKRQQSRCLARCLCHTTLAPAPSSLPPFSFFHPCSTRATRCLAGSPWLLSTGILAALRLPQARFVQGKLHSEGQSVALVSTADVIVTDRGSAGELDELAVPVLLPLRLPFPCSFRIFSGQQLRWLWSAAKGGNTNCNLTPATLSLSLLAFWQCQLSEIYTEIQQMLHCAEPSSPRRESLTHLPFGSARAELKFMASFWVSGCRGQTCACTFPSRHNMWHIPARLEGHTHAPPLRHGGIPTSEGRSFNLLTSGFSGSHFVAASSLNNKFCN